MKTFKNLYPQITTFANLDDAWRKARKGKRQKPAVAAISPSSNCGIKINSGNKPVMLRACAEAAEVSSETSRSLENQ